MMNPTGQPIRNDSGGLGYYGAPRIKTINGKQIHYMHQGVDFQCTPGQRIVAPCSCHIVRIARPYATGHYEGLLLRSKRATFKLFYIMPNRELIGKSVSEGSPIGWAQDISLRYPQSGVTPHIHLEIDHCDPMILYGKTDFTPEDLWHPSN